MAKLTKQEIIAGFDALTTAQQEEAKRLKADGASASWALRQVQSQAKQDEVRDEADQDVGFGDRMAAGATLLGAGLSGPAASAIPSMASAGHLLVGDKDAFDKSVANSRDAMEQAKKIAPSLGKVDAPLIGEIGLDPELLGNLAPLSAPAKAGLKPLGKVADAAGAVAKSKAKSVGGKMKKGLENVDEVLAKADDVMEKLPASTDTALGIAGTVAGGPIAGIAAMIGRGVLKKAKTRVTAKSEKAIEAVSEQILRELKIAPNKVAKASMKEARENFDPWELVQHAKEHPDAVGLTDDIVKKASEQLEKKGALEKGTESELLRAWLELAAQRLIEP